VKALALVYHRDSIIKAFSWQRVRLASRNIIHIPYFVPIMADKYSFNAWVLHLGSPLMPLMYSWQVQISRIIADRGDAAFASRSAAPPVAAASGLITGPIWAMYKSSLFQLHSLELTVQQTVLCYEYFSNDRFTSDMTDGISSRRRLWQFMSVWMFFFLWTSKNGGTCRVAVWLCGCVAVKLRRLQSH
jgi:hypothetical protein